MTDTENQSLLPAGFYDVLPPDASIETQAVNRLTGVFASFGYESVKPPLLEFEESLLAGSGSAMSAQTFRLMDPDSQKMMGLRPDITMQVARIATTRLKNEPRPLRLSYAGQVLRVKGSQLRPERQFGQVGAELIGPDNADADSEVIMMAAEALAALGIDGVSVDLGLPTLVPAVCDGLDLDNETTVKLRAALDRKDAAGIRDLGGLLGSDTTGILCDLMAAAGPADRAMPVLDGLRLKGRAETDRQNLKAVLDRLSGTAPDLSLTIDPVENRGFEYHTGVTFTLFARNVRGEMGRGGRYRAGGGVGEAATGLTLFMDSVLRAMPPVDPQQRLFLPFGTPTGKARDLRNQGWMTVQGLAGDTDTATEAKRLGCTHFLDGDRIAESGVKQ